MLALFGIRGGWRVVVVVFCACCDWFSELAIAATLDGAGEDEDKEDKEEEGKLEEAARRTTLGGDFVWNNDGSGVKDEDDEGDDEKIGGFRPILGGPFVVEL